MKLLENCPVCSGSKFTSHKVLWDQLIVDWQLSQSEVDYINRQQGLCCDECGNNLRSMALAAAILRVFKCSGNFIHFVGTDAAKKIKILEINESGGLTSFLNNLPCHQLVKFPEYNMINLDLNSEAFDLVLHSDTLEHISDPVAGLSECYRVLAKTGRCIFTIPIIPSRLSRPRAGLKNSYHGTISQKNVDYIVHTEFGADMWKFAIEAGFSSISIHCLEYPSALAIEAAK